MNFQIQKVFQNLFKLHVKPIQSKIEIKTILLPLKYAHNPQPRPNSCHEIFAIKPKVLQPQSVTISQKIIEPFLLLSE